MRTFFQVLIFSLIFCDAVHAGTRKTASYTQVACKVLLNPHAAIAKLLPKFSDEQALLILKNNFSELMKWLSQKADATAESGATKSKGSLGITQDMTPSMLLLGQNNIEVNRTSVGYLALKWILADDYHSFTANQPAVVRLSKDSFAKLRAYVRSVLRTPANIDAMIVMILTNDLGKVKRYHEIIERATQQVVVDHDKLLIVGFGQWPETSPNYMRLPKKQKDWILKGRRLGARLNIGQFAQAENMPAMAWAMVGGLCRTTLRRFS